MDESNATSILDELRRRKVLRTATYYIVGAWALLQISDLAFPALRVPGEAIRYVWTAAIMGLPVAACLGWRFDLINGKLMRSGSNGTVSASRLLRRDYLFLAAVALLSTAVTISVIAEIRHMRQDADHIQKLVEIDPASIAVLAFVNISDDPRNGFLAEGISEEILNALTRIEGLRVSARTSSFSFKDKDVDIPTIGQQLRVANILEGSVRMSTDTIRITAQLIDGIDGTHRWSKTYDQPIGDVLAIQDKITLDIVSELRKELDIGGVEPHVPGTTKLPEAYRHFLRGRALLRAYRRDTDQNLHAAIAEFNAAIELDRDYGDAHVALVDAYTQLTDWHSNRYRVAAAEEFAALSASSARAAILVAPTSSQALRVSGEIEANPRKKEAVFRRSIEIDPNNVNALTNLAAVLAGKNLEEALEFARRAQELDPLNHLTSDVLAELLWRSNKLKESSDYWRLSTELKFAGTDELLVPNDDFLQQVKATAGRPLNMDFREGRQSWELNPLCEKKFEFSIHGSSGSRRRYGSISSLDDSAGWCNTRQRVKADTYAGKYVRLSGVMKTEAVDTAAYMFLKAVGVNSKNFSFANGEYSPMQGDQNWTPRTLTIYVPNDARMIVFGVVLDGNGQVNFGSLELDVSDSPDFD